MSLSSPRRTRSTLRAVVLFSAVFFALVLIAAVPASAARAVFVASNAATGNQVLVFSRNADGALSELPAVATGGLGTGAGLGNQGGLVLSNDGQYLFVVNAGSDSLSVFRVGPRGPRLIQTVPSGGDMPISVTQWGDLVYVLDGGGAGNIAGFRQRPNGKLRPIAGSIQPLSGAGVGPAQIGFTPDGGVLVVSEKGTNQLTAYPVDDWGVAGSPVVNAAAGVTPFGFSFDRRGHLIVSEAFGGAPLASTISSYQVDSDGTITAIDPIVPSLQTASCWVAITPNGRYAYMTNTGSASISGFAIARDGDLEALDDDGVTSHTGMTPIDLAFANNGQFLYSLNAGDHTLSAFAVGGDGSLQPLPGASGLPAGANGLAAR